MTGPWYVTAAEGRNTMVTVERLRLADLVLFYEYRQGDNGAGQTGATR